MSISPWNDAGWVPGEVLDRSPCCGFLIYGSLADGVLAGSCSKCGAWVTRKNPKTGAVEVAGE